METTEWHRAFVADLAAEGSRLGETNMMGFGRRSAADDARFDGVANGSPSPSGHTSPAICRPPGDRIRAPRRSRPPHHHHHHAKVDAVFRAAGGGLKVRAPSAAGRAPVYSVQRCCTHSPCAVSCGLSLPASRPARSTQVSNMERRCRALWPAAQSQPPSLRSNDSCCGAAPADYWWPIPRSRGHFSNPKHNASQAREPRLSRPCGGEPPCPGVGTGRGPRKADGRTLTLMSAPGLRSFSRIVS
jgi:hypothetical protein